MTEPREPRHEIHQGVVWELLYHVYNWFQFRELLRFHLRTLEAAAEHGEGLGGVGADGRRGMSGAGNRAENQRHCQGGSGHAMCHGIDRWVPHKP